ncbi:FGGY family carbohydrate kinase [Blastococcus sp. PRF04-17]|uniref:FGGY family carbohydrate kinase n=1 Tax=Blastococcus sp. PRF04-17 TaxID=2933797 RepID=UPI001FF360AB|nr:FGGY family carbohydrate kinase [Blastococcus sp. PRF04-17]UOY01334.1 FGGY family carbohydrate kinase [Blastococcus sp. PRF04-17]
MADVLVGADLGTSGLKVVALDPTGAVVAEAEHAHGYDRPAPGWAECDVATWRAALDRALAELAARLGDTRVRALGFSGQMHGAVLVDGDGAPLRPAVLWPDQRAAGELDRWRALDADARAALANPLVPGMTGPVLAWLGRHEPEVVDRATALLLPKDALRASLLPGTEPLTDRSDASATLFWDVVADDWSAAALGAAGIAGGLLPRVAPSAEVAGTAWLPVGEVPVVVGGADTPLAMLAAGAAGVQINLGTGAQLLRSRREPTPAVDPVLHAYADTADGWYAMAALQNGGSVWEWACGVLGLSLTDFVAAAATVPSGAGGVVFRPFLTGERGGVAGPDERGAWTGLSAGTTRADLARAAAEGVVFAVRAAFDLLDVTDREPVLLTGGAARSGILTQLLADALGLPVRPLGLRSASAVGAALLAGRGVGLDVDPERQEGPLVEPSGEAHLEEAFARWSAR